MQGSPPPGASSDEGLGEVKRDLERALLIVLELRADQAAQAPSEAAIPTRPTDPLGLAAENHPPRS